MNLFDYLDIKNMNKKLGLILKEKELYISFKENFKFLKV